LTPTHVSSLRQRIQDQYLMLSGVDRKLADVLLAHESAALGYSASELAGQAGVSKASAVRFFRRLGFAGFQAFRQHLRNQQVPTSPLARLRQEPGHATALHQHLAQDAAVLQQLAQQLSDAQVHAGARLLLNARRIGVLGWRNSFMAAFYARALLAQVRPGVLLLNEAAGQDAEWLADIGAQDVLLVLDLRRRTHRLTTTVSAACAQGATLLLISDAQLSPLHSLARCSLICPASTTTAVFDSYVGVISLIHHLAQVVLALSPDATRAHLNSVEQAHRHLGDLEDQ